MHAKRRDEKSGRARTASLALALALLLAPELFADDYFYVDDASAPLTSLSDLAQEFIVQRDLTLPYPPALGLFIQPVDKSVPASLDGFPGAFRNELIAANHGGLNVYPVTCVQLRGLESIIFLNATNAIIGSVPYTDDSIWNRPAWSDADYDLQSRDPARVGLTLYLVTPADLAAADEAAELQAEINAVTADATTAVEGGMRRGNWPTYQMQSLQEMSFSNLIIAAIQPVDDGAQLSIGLPAGWSNRLDVIVSDDLGPFLWRWRATLNDATNGISFDWVDTNAPAIDRTFHLLGNADIDSDGDGISDAIERYVTKTSPTSVDTDDDGMNDGWEVTNGHNPLDPNDPPNVRGTIGYSGGQTGPVIVVAVETPDSWATNNAVRLDSPGTYRISNLTATNYWIKAFVDSNGDASNGLTEAWGRYSTNAIEITNMVVGIDFSLADLDTDGDGRPDWWEVANRTDPNNPDMIAPVVTLYLPPNGGVFTVMP